MMALQISVTLDAQAARRALAQLGRDLPQRLGQGMYAEAEAIMTDSKANYCPVDTGALRASGQVEAPVIEGSLITVQLGYGNSSVPYALRQHEDLTYKHKVGSAKYLELPMMAAFPGMPERLARRVLG